MNRYQNMPEKPRTSRVKEGPSPAYGALLGLPGGASTQLIARAAAGLPFRALERLSDNTGIPLAETARIAQIAPRTLSRRKAAGKLSPAESDRVLRTARVLSQAIELFEGDVDAARSWLQAPQRAFGGVRPIELAQTDSGAHEVEMLIGRLEHGIFS